MSEFIVRGRFQLREDHAEFETTIDAENENLAREYALSRLGSQHGLKRHQIDLSEVEAR